MPTLGEELKQRREARGITLSDISEATRIGTRFLKAIETDNYSVLPGGIFTRSFIRAYARQVGMNEDEALAIYQQQVTGQTDELVALPVEELVERRGPDAGDQARARWPAVVIAASIIVAAVILVFGFLKLAEDRDKEGPRNVNSSAPVTTEKPVQPAETSAKPTGSGAAPKLPAETIQNPPGSAAAPTLAGQSFAVTLEATTGDCWVGYQVDDNKAASTTLKRGETKILPPAQDQVTLTIGNRPNLILKINNRQASFPPDTPNFKAQIVISRDNLKTFLQ